MWAPVYIVNNKKFIFAYTDQIFDTEDEAIDRGKYVGSALIDAGSEARYNDEIIDVREYSRLYDVETVPIMGSKIVFIEGKEKKKNERGRRKKRNIS